MVSLTFYHSFGQNLNSNFQTRPFFIFILQYLPNVIKKPHLDEVCCLHFCSHTFGILTKLQFLQLEIHLKVLGHVFLYSPTFVGVCLSFGTLSQPIFFNSLTLITNPRLELQHKEIVISNIS